MRERQKLEQSTSSVKGLEAELNDGLGLLEMAEAENDAAMITDAEKSIEGLSKRARSVRVLVSVSNAMHLVARERPTIDVGLVALAGALGLPRGAPLAIFACGRLGGWIAHGLEQEMGQHRR